MDRKDLEVALLENEPNLVNKRLWIWGAGNTAQLYQEGFLRLEKEGFKFEGYIDKKIAKQKEVFYGKPVIEPSKIVKLENVCILICTSCPDVIYEIKEQCEKSHIESYLIDEVILKKHSAEVLKCYDMMCDQQSKDIYAELVKWRISGIKSLNIIQWENQYFCLERFLQKDPEEVFVDLGAYIGDTIE